MGIRKEKNKHLGDDLRLELEAAVRARKSFSQINRELGIPRSTIKREIMDHREESTKTFYGRRFNPCTHRDSCKAYGMCGRPDCARNPDVQVPQFDTVEGGRNDKRVLLTAIFPNMQFMVARLLPGKCARHVTDAFNWMWNTLGDNTFKRLFPAHHTSALSSNTARRSFKNSESSLSR